MAKKDLKREIYNNFPAKLSENENPTEGESIPQNTDLTGDTKLTENGNQKSNKSTSQNTNPTEPPKNEKEGDNGKKVGRPKTKDIKNTCRNINVAVSIVLLDKWEEIKIVHGSNLTAYITKLIKKDMDTNYEKYKKIADSLKNI